MNGGLLVVDLLSKSFAARPISEEQGMTESVFRTSLGQNVFVTVLRCPSILSRKTWSRWVQRTAFTLPFPLRPFVTRSGRRLQSLRDSSLKDTIGTMAFESDATRRTSDSKLNCDSGVRQIARQKEISHLGNLRRYPGS